MKNQLKNSCAQHGDYCPDKVLMYSEGIGYLLIANNAEYSIQYCPWCGKAVPKGFSPERPGRYLFNPSGELDWKDTHVNSILIDKVTTVLGVNVSESLINSFILEAVEEACAKMSQ